jgi:hypothetical protein
MQAMRTAAVKGDRMNTEPLPTDTLSWLDLLLREDHIAIQRGAVLDATPEPVPLRKDRFEGMLLGLGSATRWAT